jgi:hypothetical protein
MERWKENFESERERERERERETKVLKRERGRRKIFSKINDRMKSNGLMYSILMIYSNLSDIYICISNICE